MVKEVVNKNEFVDKTSVDVRPKRLGIPFILDQNYVQNKNV